MTDDHPGDVTVAEQRDRFRAWLGRERDAGGDAAGAVSLIETHVSILGIGADRVWKLKKAVRFPFVDLSTVELRRRNATREVELNRRFAPDVYLGVVPLDARDEHSEVVVEMRRMPDDRRLAVVAATAAGPACVDRIADALVRIHAQARTDAVIARAGSARAVADLWTENADEMRPFTPAVLDPAALDRVASAAHLYIAGRGPLFAQRIGDGRIRDGHGDLLADDVFCLDDGPRFLDCLEFDDGLRYGDVLADVGFLAMDLERLGHRDLADRLLARYRQVGGDPGPQSLCDLYVAYRALVRAKIACLRVTADDDTAATAARALLGLAAEHLRRGRVRLVLVGGPPATGKTTLAREIVRRTGWDALHSDEIRKELAGLDPTTSAAAALDAGLYTPEWNARTYAALFERARARLAHGVSVVLDASWSDTAPRVEAAELAASTTSALDGFLLTVDPAVADARARTRFAAHADASDASERVTGALRERFAAWPEGLALDAAAAPDALATRVLERVDYPA